MSLDTGGLDRVATNELLYVRLARRAQSGGGGLEVVADFSCECTNPGCPHRFAMTAAEYEPIRASSALFVVAPAADHFDTTAERIVTEQQTHWVIERTPSVEVLAFFGRSREEAAFELLLDPSGPVEGEGDVVRRLTIAPRDDPEGVQP